MVGYTSHQKGSDRAASTEEKLFHDNRVTVELETLAIGKALVIV
ncbi:MAG TPA: hypothetical protein VEP90_02895 [Methylomirabilota bacterium]|nr:hypothetical protein [Methylomirabilota bacterium]